MTLTKLQPQGTKKKPQKVKSDAVWNAPRSLLSQWQLPVLFQCSFSKHYLHPKAICRSAFCHVASGHQFHWASTFLSVLCDSYGNKGKPPKENARNIRTDWGIIYFCEVVLFNLKLKKLVHLRLTLGCFWTNLFKRLQKRSWSLRQNVPLQTTDWFKG